MTEFEKAVLLLLEYQGAILSEVAQKEVGTHVVMPIAREMMVKMRALAPSAAFLLGMGK